MAAPLSASLDACALRPSFPGLSTNGRLREDGGFHLLATTDDGGALMLHPQFGALVAYPAEAGQRMRVIQLGSVRTSVWTLVAARFGVRIGSDRLPRFWLLEERVPLGTTMYACYDLEEWAVVGWMSDEAEAVRQVQRSNAGELDGGGAVAGNPAAGTS